MTKDNTNLGSTNSRLWRRVLRDAGGIVGVGVLMATVTNVLRGSTRLPWVATKPYEIVVPCPEPVGQAQAIAPTSAALRGFASYVIDARSTTEFATWHWPGAVNIPFDWLGPPVKEEVYQLAKKVAASKSKQIVVYGDGEDPDSGREWARLLSGGGIRNVLYVEGGAPALMKANTKNETTSPATLSTVGRENLP